jgi:uncharacterized Zn-binding protein involved in type VI secretion
MSVSLKVAVIGDKTTTGGVILDGAGTVYSNGSLVALIGSKASCPACKSVGVIRRTHPHSVEAENKQVCLDGSIVECKCPLGSNKVIASPGANEFIGYDNGSVGSRMASFDEAVQAAQDMQPATQLQPTITPLPVGELCEAEPDILANGVFVWTESKATGHAFVSVHLNWNIFVFTYGRFDASNFSPVGSGVLIRYYTENAKAYYRKELYTMRARVFKVTDVDENAALSAFESQWLGSSSNPTITSNEKIKEHGRIIDDYNLATVNCTTTSVNGLKKAGSSIFNVTSPIGLKYEESFSVPISLERFLLQVASEGMNVVEVTSEFRTVISSTSDKEMGSAGIANETAGASANSSSMLGSSFDPLGGSR